MPGMVPGTRTLPDFDDCTMVLVYNRRRGLFKLRHLVPLAPRINEKERYKYCDLKLLPGINLAPEEWIVAMRKYNEAFDRAFTPHKGMLEMLGSREQWANRNEHECVKMVAQTSSVEALEILSADETRKSVVQALDDELEAHREHKKLQDEARREARRSQRKAGNQFGM